jgi:hypothetical protein
MHSVVMMLNYTSAPSLQLFPTVTDVADAHREFIAARGDAASSTPSTSASALTPMPTAKKSGERKHLVGCIPSGARERR